MTTKEAALEAGLSVYTIKCEAHRGSFEADLPRGRRGGWDIDPNSFRAWLIRRRMKTGNAPARARARRQLAELGAL